MGLPPGAATVNVGGKCVTQHHIGDSHCYMYLLLIGHSILANFFLGSESRVEPLPWSFDIIRCCE